MNQVLNILKSGDYSTSLNLEVFNRIPKGSTVLDIGCWNGNLGERLLKHKNCIVDGIDADAKQLKVAKERGYRHTFQFNLNSEHLDLSSLNEIYDVLVFADVLEHLVNPDAILKAFKEKVKQGGVIIISLPNVAFMLNRINLLLGKWNYTEFGTLDKTHLRFFTINTGVILAERAGYKIVEVVPYNQFGLLTKLNNITRLLPAMMAYQFLIVAGN